MAVYKVAQDVEADDKLLGPFSFRQFIYLIIVVIAIALAWGLAQLFIGLVILPIPIILFFGALALPLRKDQPMEIYLAALVSFYLKPRKRMWIPDGIESLIEITVPKVIEVQRTKALSETEAERRLSYLADIADTGGWAIRHSITPAAENSMTSDAFYAAQTAEDVLDDSGGVAQSFNTMISQADERRHQEMVARMQQATAQNAAPVQPIVPPVADPYATLSQPQASPAIDPQLAANSGPSPTFNPYPTSIHQSVIQPLSQGDQLAGQVAQSVPQTTPVAPRDENTRPSTSETPLSPDIINLASNTDLSIETIQREANRIQHKSEDDGEVFISLH